MLSYCYEVTADNAEQVLPPKEDNSALASLRNRIEAFRLDENGLEKDYFIFLEQYHGNHLTLGAALTEHLGREPQDFLQSLGLTGVRLEKAEEITGSRLRGMLEKAEDQKLVADWRSWPDQFACLHFYRRGGHHFEPDSRILRDKLLARKRPWAELARRTEELMYSGTLLPELERIRRPAAAPFSGGYPVHYLVQAEHFPDQQEIVGLLLQALYQAGRLESRRYCICDLDDIKGFMDVTEICGNAAYGALVVMAGEVERGGAFAKSDLNSIKLLADCFDLFGDSLQMVVCLPTGAAEAREALLEQLEGHGAGGTPGGTRHTGAGPGLSPEEGEKGRGAGGPDPLPGPGRWAQPPSDGAGRAAPALARLPPAQPSLSAVCPHDPCPGPGCRPETQRRCLSAAPGAGGAGAGQGRDRSDPGLCQGAEAVCGPGHGLRHAGPAHGVYR